MSIKFDLVIENARVVDYASQTDEILNIGILDGCIAELSKKNLSASTTSVYPAENTIALPGIIDTHTHLSKTFGGGIGGCAMLAKAGVCTTLEMGGPIEDVLKIVKNYGSGINIALLEGIVPKSSIPDANPDNNVIDKFITNAMIRGALGIKILGGHYPLTPEASLRLVKKTYAHNAYLAWHCGSTKTDNSIIAVREFFDITKGYAVHIAHVNSYCRGLVNYPLEEANETIRLLEENPLVFAESYIAATNGVMLNLNEQGNCASKATGQNLNFLGFEDSKEGLLKAIDKGIVHVFHPQGIEIVPITGKKAVQVWKDFNGNIGGGMDINPPDVRLALCLSKNKNQEFVVDALSTDGGIIPRNVIVENGLGLVKINALTLQDFIYKTSYKPAQWLNLPNKGHLSIGADADITIVNLEKQKAVTTIVKGKIIMHQGMILGKEGTILTCSQGKNFIENYGLQTSIIQK